MADDQSTMAKAIPTAEVSPQDFDVLYELPSRFPEGVELRLAAGEYLISRTITLPSRTSLVGAGIGKTNIVLAKGSNCHLFTNSDHRSGNTDLAFRNFSVDGQGDSQHRPDGHKALTFCCAMYLRRCVDVEVSDCSFFDIRQTAAHFSECLRVLVQRMASRKLGWSGVSTSGTSDIWVEAVVEDAGRDDRHSAIHMDGGVGVYVEAEVSDTTGNGIMLDSAYAPLLKAVARGSAVRCLRGVSLSGSAEKDLSHVYIEGNFNSNAEIGVMVSNAQHVVIANSEIKDNGVAGIRFQGRNGGRDCLVVNTRISGSPSAYEHMHASGGNWVFERTGQEQAGGAINRNTLKRTNDALVDELPPIRWRLIG